MKKKFYTGVMLCAMTLIAGCSQEELTNGQAQSDNFSLVANTETDTRTSVGTDYKVLWSEQDEIYVFGGTAYGTLDLSAGSGSTSGTFDGTIKNNPADLKYAVYPKPTISNESKTINFPATYATYPYQSNSPMYGVLSNDKKSVTFQHLCGMIRLTINGIPSSGSKTLTLTSQDGAITGDASLNENGTENTLSLGTPSGDGKTITITIPNGQTGPVFDIPLPTATYTNGLAIKLKEGNSELVAEKTVANLNIQKGHILVMDALTYISIEGNAPSFTTSVKSIDEAEKALENGSNNVAIDEVETTSGAQSISVPATSDASVPTTIGIASLSTGNNPLTIKEKESTTVNQNVNLLIGNAEGDNTSAKINIELENSHVTLSPMNGTTTFAEVTAKTSSNTLVVDEGVTITKLIVKGGNVRVSGIVSEITKDNELSGTPYIIKEEGATIPSTTTGFTVIDAVVYDLVETMKNGGDYTLNADINIVGRDVNVPAGKAFTLDLNGHTIEAANDGKFKVYGTFTLKDSKGTGKIASTQDYATEYTSTLIYVEGESAKMIMEGGNIYAVRSDAVDKGHFGVGLYEGGDFTMTGGKIEAGWFAVSGNGNYQSANSVIEIQGGELISQADYAIYLPQAGTTTVSGGTITGACGGIGVRSGTLNIKDNAKIICTGTGSTGDWKDGTGNTGNAVINIGNGKQNTYGNCTVNISGGTLTAEGNAVVIDKRTADAKHTIAVNVTGGIFSDPDVLQHLGANANVKIAMNEDKSCPGFKTANGQTVEIDLNNHTFTLSDPTVGSTGTETNSCQLLKGSTVTFKNGTLVSDNKKIIIQNYCNLTLDGITVKGTEAEYVVSNNCGHVLINNTTLNAGSGKCAFDVCGYSTYTEGVYVTVKGSSVINGKVELSKSTGNTEPMQLNIEGGSFMGALVIDSSVGTEAAKGIIKINGNPTFTDSSWDAYKSNN